MSAVIDLWVRTQQELDALLDYLCDPEADIETTLAVEHAYGVTPE